MSNTYMINGDAAAFSPRLANDKVVFKGFNLWYGENHVLKDVNAAIKSNIVTAFMGPSGCGKSTLLRSIDRMNDNPELQDDGRRLHRPPQHIRHRRRLVHAA
jgi:ABC-type phosphate transport system ATPase subunit